MRLRSPGRLCRRRRVCRSAWHSEPRCKLEPGGSVRWRSATGTSKRSATWTFCVRTRHARTRCERLSTARCCSRPGASRSSSRALGLDLPWKPWFAESSFHDGNGSRIKECPIPWLVSRRRKGRRFRVNPLMGPAGKPKRPRGRLAEAIQRVAPPAGPLIVTPDSTRVEMVQLKQAAPRRQGRLS